MLQDLISFTLILVDDKGRYNKRWAHYKIIRKHTILYASIMPYVRRVGCLAIYDNSQQTVNQSVKIICKVYRILSSCLYICINTHYPNSLLLK